MPNFFLVAEAAVPTIDLSSTLSAIQTQFFSVMNVVLPVAGIIFATIMGIRFAPKLIKIFAK